MNKCLFQKVYQNGFDMDSKDLTAKEASTILMSLVKRFYDQRNDFLKEIDGYISLYSNENTKDQKRCDQFLDLRNVFTDYFNTKILKFIIFDIEAFVSLYAPMKNIKCIFDKETVLRCYMNGSKYQIYRSENLDQKCKTILNNMALDQFLTVGSGDSEIIELLKNKGLDDIVKYENGSFCIYVQEIKMEDEIKCPECGHVLINTPMSMCIDRSQQKKNWCPTCHKHYSEKDIQNIKDAKMIEEDTKIWKESQKHK